MTTDSPTVVGVFRDRVLVEPCRHGTAARGISRRRDVGVGTGRLPGWVPGVAAAHMVGTRNGSGGDRQLPAESGSDGRGSRLLPTRGGGGQLHRCRAFLWTPAGGQRLLAAGRRLRCADEPDPGSAHPPGEEVLTPHTHSVQVGAVIIRKEVITEEKTITVTVQREGVVIERLPLSSPGTPGVEPTGTLVELAPGQTIRIPIREEQVLLEKRPLVTHELIVGKRTVQETQRFIETVRREEPRLERQGEVIVHASTGENDGA